MQYEIIKQRKVILNLFEIKITKIKDFTNIYNLRMIIKHFIKRVNIDYLVGRHFLLKYFIGIS